MENWQNVMVLKCLGATGPIGPTGPAGGPTGPTGAIPRLIKSPYNFLSHSLLYF